jgi:GNAT superfamily N-acetyltransferase
MESCSYCDRTAMYRDRETGTRLCPVHARLEVTGPRGEAPRPPVTVRPASGADRERIVGMAEAFWDEREIDCFGRTYAVGELPAFVACDVTRIVGVASYALEGDALALVMLNVLPLWQGRGVATYLIEALAGQARRDGACRLIVATTNDDLPALAFYQRLGFVITDVFPGRVLEEHGLVKAGFSGIHLRDEIQLELAL